MGPFPSMADNAAMRHALRWIALLLAPALMIDSAFAARTAGFSTEALVSRAIAARGYALEIARLDARLQKALSAFAPRWAFANPSIRERRPSPCGAFSPGTDSPASRSRRPLFSIDHDGPHAGTSASAPVSDAVFIDGLNAVNLLLDHRDEIVARMIAAMKNGGDASPAVQVRRLRRVVADETFLPPSLEGRLRTTKRRLHHEGMEDGFIPRFEKNEEADPYLWNAEPYLFPLDWYVWAAEHDERSSLSDDDRARISRIEFKVPMSALMRNGPPYALCMGSLAKN